MEAMVACIVLSILVLGVCGALSTAYQQTCWVRANANSVLLARQLADEITAKPMVDPTKSLGPETGMTLRSQFNYVTNYSGYSDTSTALSTLGLQTAPIDATSAAAYGRAVTVSVGAKPSVDVASPSTDFALVTVTVTAPDGQNIAVTKLVANYPIQR
jgi:Tfp pilus assembly protein PilV